MKHLTLFSQHQGYDNFFWEANYDGTLNDYAPNVSYCELENEVHFGLPDYSPK